MTEEHSMLGEVRGSVRVGGTTYQFTELAKPGTLTRGIKVWISGQAGSDREYKLAPNPHDCKAYNKKQVQFYTDLATQLGTYHGANAAFPADGWQTPLNVAPCDGQYTLTSWR